MASLKRARRSRIKVNYIVKAHQPKRLLSRKTDRSKLNPGTGQPLIRAPNETHSNTNLKMMWNLMNWPGSSTQCVESGSGICYSCESLNLFVSSCDSLFNIETFSLRVATGVFYSRWFAKERNQNRKNRFNILEFSRSCLQIMRTWSSPLVSLTNFLPRRKIALKTCHSVLNYLTITGNFSRIFRQEQRKL